MTSNMVNISIIVLFLSPVLFCHCEVMRDPHDMFEIFKDLAIKESSDEMVQQKQKDNKSDSEHASCKQIARSKSCTDLLHTLLQSLDQLFIKEENDRDHDFSVRLSLTSSEIDELKHRSLHSISEDKLCSTLQLAIKREPLESLFWNLFYGLIDLVNWTLEMLKDLTHQIKLNFRLNLKDFVVYLWIMLFISCLYVMVVSRSVILTLSWILLCVVFISTYTTYQHKYQVAVAKQEALLLPYKNKNMPHECSNPVKAKFTLFWESIFGAGPVEMSNACKEFYKNINISPEVEIKISDALAETVFTFISKIMYAVFIAADDIAGQISEKQPFFSRSFVYWSIYGIVLTFGLSILLFYSGGNVSFFGVSIHHRQTNAPIQIPHRQCVETVPTPSPAPQIHIHLPANMAPAMQPNIYNQNRENKERIDWYSEEGQSNQTKLTHRRPYRKLKSIQFIKQSTSMEANSNRRLSF